MRAALLAMILTHPVHLFGLWTSCSLKTVTKSKEGCSCLVGGFSCATVTKSLDIVIAIIHCKHVVYNVVYMGTVNNSNNALIWLK